MRTASCSTGLEHLLGAFLIWLAFSPVPTAFGATMLTFEDLPSTPVDGQMLDHPLVPNCYGGLQWTNCFVVDGAHSQPVAQYDYSKGVVSPNGSHQWDDYETRQEQMPSLE